MDNDALVVQRTKAWIADELTQRADDFDKGQELPPDVVGRIYRSGLLKACVATKYGGLGLDDAAVGELCEALGAASCSVLSLFTVHTMVSVAISRWGTDAQRAAWLPRLADGSLVAALALSEVDAGSDVGAIRTTIVRTGDAVVLSGAKTWISFGQVAGVFLVSGLLEGSVATVLVDRATPGIAVTPIRDMYGFRSAMLAQIEFTDCVVPAANLLGDSSFGLSRIVGSVLDHGRFCIAWGSAGLARACLEAAVDYAQTRVQFGKPLLEHPLIQQQITDIMVHGRAATLMCRDATEARLQRRSDILARTTAAKYFAAKNAEMVSSMALQIHGANGFTDKYSVQRHARDAKILNLIEGSTHMQQMLIAQYSRQWMNEAK